MNVRIEVDYKAGGYPYPTYRGTKQFGMNVDEDQNEFDILEEGRSRARSMIAKDGCWNVSSVSITSIRIL